MTIVDGAQLVRSERVPIPDGEVLVLRLNRPAARNPIDFATLEELEHLIEAAIGDPAVRAVALTGTGEAFSSGGDLKGYQLLYQDHGRFKEFMERFDRVCELLERSRLVTAAMVNGTCVAGGLELALACDFVTMAEGARIGDAHLRFAQLPGAGGSQRLVRAIGVQRARQWLLTGALFTAEQALDSGLVAAVVPEAELVDHTMALLGSVCSATPLGLARMKELIGIALDEPLGAGLVHERDIVYQYATSSYDAAEGLMAFAERRPANYLGR